MADAIDSSVCDLIGLGRSTVLQPDLPAAVLLNPAVQDADAFGVAHVVKGQWLTRFFPARVLGGGYILQFFYHNMRRLGKGLSVDAEISLPGILVADVIETWKSGIKALLQRLSVDRTSGSRRKTT